MGCSRSPLVSIPTSLPPVVVTGKRRKPVSSMICAASRMDMSGATVRTCRFIISWALRVLCRACSSGASMASAVRSSSSSAVRTKPRRIGKSPALIRSPVLIMPWSRRSPSMTGSARNGAASSRLTTTGTGVSGATVEITVSMTCRTNSFEDSPRRAFIVIAGLDPAIHRLRKTLSKIDGCAGQARA